jgi:mono/diheme cytochrome c family protein
MKRRRLMTVVLLAAALLGGACRGQPSSRPPLRLIGDMTLQPKVRPQAAGRNGSGMQPLVAGVVAQEELREDDAYYRGRQGRGYVARVPLVVDSQVLTRGEERFNIYCSPCHDRAGSARGVIPQRGFPGPVDLASPNTRGLKDGEIFNVITQGVRNMPAYRSQVPVSDRWAIVTWVRVLQRSQHATLADVRADLVPTIQPEEPGS